MSHSEKLYFFSLVFYIILCFCFKRGRSTFEGIQETRDERKHERRASNGNLLPLSMCIFPFFCVSASVSKAQMPFELVLEKPYFSLAFVHSIAFCSHDRKQSGNASILSYLFRVAGQRATCFSYYLWMLMGAHASAASYSLRCDVLDLQIQIHSEL